MFPGVNGQTFSLSGWSCGELFEALEAHKVPLLIDKDLIEWDQIVNICNTYKSLPLIVCEIWYKDNRYVYPLLEKLPNFYLGMCRFIGHQCLEDICRKYGASHLVFGSKMPVFTAGPVISMITYAEITETQKEEMAGNNLRKLLREVS